MSTATEFITLTMPLIDELIRVYTRKSERKDARFTAYGRQLALETVVALKALKASRVRLEGTTS